MGIFDGFSFVEHEVKSEPNYTIENEVLSVPVTRRYVLEYNIVPFVASDMTSAFTKTNTFITQEFKSVEAVKDYIQNNLDYLVTYITKKKHGLTFNDVVREIVEIRLNKVEDPFTSPSTRVSTKTFIESADIALMIESSVKYSEALVEFEHRDKIRKEQEENFELNRTRTIRQNNYEMWKVLQSKKDAGEFDDLIDC